jgi:hypothetical protein
MKTETFTLSIPISLLRKAEQLAAQRQTSLAEFITQLLVERLDQEDRYVAAWERNLAALRHGFDLGTNGKIAWRREDLYDR